MKYTLYDTNISDAIRHGMDWPTIDGTPPPDLDGNLILLEEISAIPYNPREYTATQEWVYDLNDNTAVFSNILTEITLEDAKATRKAELENEANIYVEEKYPSASTLMILFQEANNDRPDRLDYILPWVMWREKILAEAKAKQDDVDAAATVGAVNLIQLDTATLDGLDPEITISGAVAVSDSLDLTTFLDSNVKVTDPITGISGCFWLMQLMVNRREIFNDTDNPLYTVDQVSLLDSVSNLNDIHAKLGWHRQEIFKQGWRRPTDMLFYYGYPNSYNSGSNGWVNENVAQDMARYGIVVLGNGVENPSHPDYANSSIIIPRVQALNPYTKIFGYVTLNQSLANFQTQVDQWNTLDVAGIFIDEAGYDYGDVSTNGRDAFNTKIDYVHSRSTANICFANAWNTDNVLGVAEDGAHPNVTWNSAVVESNLTINDWILLESLAVNTVAYSATGGYASKSDWLTRIGKAMTLRATYGVNFGSLGVIDDSDVNGQDLFNFAFVSSMMGCLEGNGTSSLLYGSSTAQVTHWGRPDTTKIGAAWTINGAILLDAGDADVYHHYTEFAKLSLDFSTGSQISSIILS